MTVTMVNCLETGHKFRETHLNSANVPRPVRPHSSPLWHVRGIRLRHADGKVFEHAAEELEIGELDGIDPDVLAHLHNHKMVLHFPVGRFGSTRAEHVSILL